MTKTQPSDDATLVKRAKQGDQNAIANLYERHLPAVYNRVRYVIPEQDVEDITQEVFIAVLKSVHSFRGDALFTTWLRTLTNRRIAEYYRKRSRKQEKLQVSLESAENLISNSNRSSASIEEKIALRHGLSQLQDRYREVILLRFAEGLKFEQIAEAMELNPEAAKSLFRRAITALRKNLD
ncbi:MAG: RNA polymerase sigma factor [Anaerolineales bacterium]|nr:RNA polymerase sigma factor [Anaerolineales bacterium]